MKSESPRIRSRQRRNWGALMRSTAAISRLRCSPSPAWPRPWATTSLPSRGCCSLALGPPRQGQLRWRLSRHVHGCLHPGRRAPRRQSTASTTATRIPWPTRLSPLLRARFASEGKSRRDAFGAAAELAALLGWKHHDLGQEGAAQRYCQTGFQLACEADPHGHAAWMMRALAHQSLSMGQPAHCADLAEAAISRARGRVDGYTDALLHITHARARAAAGRRRAAMSRPHPGRGRKDEGRRSTARFSLASGPTDGTIASHTARTLTALADHAGTERQHPYRAHPLGSRRLPARARPDIRRPRRQLYVRPADRPSPPGPGPLTSSTAWHPTARAWLSIISGRRSPSSCASCSPVTPPSPAESGCARLARPGKALRCA